jgi:hypothetical protein
MKLTFNASSPTRIEVLLNPGDVLEVNPELGARLQRASGSLVPVKAPKPKPKPKPTTGKKRRRSS